ncbi:MAG: ribosome-associated translation inhibitor RaiA [Nitrospinae bacterium]|nr:ribosome-associated translation inhibitor RaiA [Nitrospinota bacterium]
MQLHIHGRKVEVTPALKDYALQKALVVRKFLDLNIRANITLSVDKFRQIAEVTVTGNGVNMHGKEESEDMYASIDLVMDKIVTQAKKYKEKHKEHDHVRGSEISPDLSVTEEL